MELSKLKRNWLKLNIKDIINYFDEGNYEQRFNEIINDSITNDKIIKYIIKIISFNIKTTKEENIKQKYYELFLLLIKNLSREDIIKYLTNLLIFLQENINNVPIEIGFELIINIFDKFELKIFEILNGFCIHNMKNNIDIIQKKSLLCYEILVLNYDKCLVNKNDILKSIIDNIILFLKNESFNDRYHLLECLNKIICVSKDKYKNYVELTIYYIMDYLFMNDNNIKFITMNIISNIIKYNIDMVKNLKNEIYKCLMKLIDDKYIDTNLKKIIFDILNKLGFNMNINMNISKSMNMNNTRENKKKESNTKKYIENLKEKKMQNTHQNSKAYLLDDDNSLEDFLLHNKSKSKINNKSNSNSNIKDKEIKNKSDGNTNKKIVKINPNKIHNKNVKVEIFLKKDLNKIPKLTKRKVTPLTTNQRKIEESISYINNNDYKYKKDKFVSTYINEDEYLNPIKMWYNFDNKHSKTSTKNKRNKKPKENNNKINIDKSINNSQINIINQSKEEPKLELIMNEIMKISKTQNFLAEKITALEKNTHKQISYFNSRIDELENNISNNELIDNEHKNNADNADDVDNDIINDEVFINNEYKIIYPSNTINEKLIAFLNIKENDKSIYCLAGITEEQMIKIDNNLIEDVVNKLIKFLEQNIYTHESIRFIKKVFIRNKMKFKLNTIKKLLSTLDRTLMNKEILSNEDSFDISLIISSINIDKI